MSLPEYIFLAVSSLFVIVDPLAAGVLLAAVAIQFMLNAVRQLNPAWLPAAA